MPQLGGVRRDGPDSKQISQELEQAKAAKPAQPEVVEALQSALNALEERKGSLERIKQYQEVIDNYPKLSATLRAQLNNMRDEPRSVSPGMSTDALNQEILQVSSQLLDKKPSGPARAGTRPRDCRFAESTAATANRCPPSVK